MPNYTATGTYAIGPKKNMPFSHRGQIPDVTAALAYAVTDTGNQNNIHPLEYRRYNDKIYAPVIDNHTGEQLPTNHADALGHTILSYNRFLNIFRGTAVYAHSYEQAVMEVECRAARFISIDGTLWAESLAPVFVCIPGTVANGDVASVTVVPGQMAEYRYSGVGVLVFPVWGRQAVVEFALDHEVGAGVVPTVVSY